MPSSYFRLQGLTTASNTALNGTTTQSVESAVDIGATGRVAVSVQRSTAGGTGSVLILQTAAVKDASAFVDVSPPIDLSKAGNVKAVYDGLLRWVRWKAVVLVSSATFIVDAVAGGGEASKAPEIRRADVTLTLSSDTGWTSTGQLWMLGRQGRILAVKVREDVTEDWGTAAEVYVVDASAAVEAAPDDRDVIYASGSIALSGSGTVASLEDALPIPAPYAVDQLGGLRVAANVTAGTGSDDTKLHVTVFAEVWA